MTTIEIGGARFRVEFRHRNKFTRKPGLMRHAPYDAITTCTIIGLREAQGGVAPADPIAFVAIGNSVCVSGDRYSRRDGRVRSFRRAVEDCAPLRPISDQLIAAFDALSPAPPARKPVAKLSMAERHQKWEAGAEVRARRAASNGGETPIAAS